MGLLSRTEVVHIVLLLSFQLISLSNANLVSSVLGLLHGDTNGGHNPSSDYRTNHPSNDRHGYGPDADDGNAEYFDLANLPDCGVNEYFEFCGSSCMESCKAFRFNYTAGETPNDQCKLRCDEGCYCRPGYRRHPATGGCVLKSCCPPADHEVYNSCETTVKYCGGLYEVYREDFNSCLESCDMNPVVCSKEMLYNGCFCEEGFKRNYKGVCVPEKKCCTREDGYIYQSKEYKNPKKDYL